MMAMRRQMDESNQELINTFTQQIGTIFNPLITNTNQTYELLENQKGCIADFFGMPLVQVWPTPQISNVRLVDTPENWTTQAIVCQNQGFQPKPPPHREEVEQIEQNNPRPLIVQRNQNVDQVLR